MKGQVRLTTREFLQMLCVMLIMTLCTPSRAGAGPFDLESALPLADDVKELDTRWEYRLGDPERKPGQPADAALQDPKGWQKLSAPSRLPDPGAKNNHFLWLKVHLPTGAWESPALLLESADVLLEIYASGKLLFSNGAIDPMRKPPLMARDWHLLSLPESALGKPLLIRVQKNASANGLGRVFVGSKHQHFTRILSASMAKLVLGSIALLLGLFSVAMSLTRGSQRSLLQFGLFASFAGLYMAFSAPMRRQWLAQPGFWESSELAMLFLVPVGLAAFLERSVEGRPSVYCRRAWQIHLGFFVLAILAAIPGIVPLRQVQPLFLGMVTITGVALAVLALRAVWDKGTERRVAVAAVGFVMFMALFDIVKDILVTPALSPWPPLTHVGFFGGTLALAFLLVQRNSRAFIRVEASRGQLERAFQGSLDVVRQNEILLASCKAAESIVREIDVGAICNVLLYIRVWDGSDEDPVFRQSTLVSQGRLVENPKLVPLKQKHESSAETMLARAAPLVTSTGLVVVPLTVTGRKWGFLTFDNYARDALTPADGAFLRLMTSTLSHVIENIQFLMESRSRAQGEVESEATTALQRLLLPQTVQVPSAQVATNYQAARKSGGDWFGYHHHDKRNRVDFFIGDVTGHGVTSALLAGVAAGAVHSLEGAYGSDCFQGSSDEERLLHMARIVNRVVFEAGKEKLFMGMMFLTIDLDTGEGLFLNSGHQPFYHIQCATNKTNSIMPNPGNALGYSLSPNYSVQSFRIQPGDLLFLYTAGLFGNQGPGNKKLGVRKFKTLLEKSRDPIEIQTLVLDAAKEIWQNQAAADDVTTVVFKWLGPSRVNSDEPPATTMEMRSPVSRSA